MPGPKPARLALFGARWPGVLSPSVEPHAECQVAWGRWVKHPLALLLREVGGSCELWQTVSWHSSCWCL